MKIKISGILSALSLVLVLSVQAIASPADVINTFALRAARELGRTESAYFFSPFSILSAFGMAYAGASGNTAQEIERALGFTKSLHEELGGFVQDIANTGQVSSANRVWLDETMSLNADYLGILHRCYSSTAETLDIQNSPEAACRVINAWAKSRTNGKIPKLLSWLDPATRMVITNAVYFNAQWQAPFSKMKTSPEKFRDGEKISQVPMMKKYTRFQFGMFEGTKVVSIPYSGGRISMLVVLPPEDRPDALEGLTAEILKWRISELQRYEVDLWLPKFRTEKSYEFSGIFKVLGVKRAFTDGADFSGMSSSEALKIDAVIHKTFIDVDEEKTEAAAATAIPMMRATAAPVKIPRAEFHADRPFVYFIVDNNTGTILFMGRQTF